jgi:mannitol-1-phosphate/altronate dehydrogenase
MTFGAGTVQSTCPLHPYGLRILSSMAQRRSLEVVIFVRHNGTRNTPRVKNAKLVVIIQDHNCVCKIVAIWWLQHAVLVITPDGTCCDDK